MLRAPGFTFCLFVILSCSDELDPRVVYQNTFEEGDLTGISGGVIHEFNDSNLLGNYNNQSFSLSLENLDKHNLIIIEFDLYIHDSWDGNIQGVGGPDTWSVHVDDWLKFNNEVSERKIFKTSFSNTNCRSTYCLLQSYPEIYPFNNYPGTNSTSNTLPALCKTPASSFVGTRTYEMEIVFQHKGSTADIKFEDQLVQTNAPNPICDESWSLDNLKISISK